MSAVSVELTPDQIAKIQREVIASVTEQLRKDVMDSFNVRQLVSEVKNGVVRAIAEKIASEMKASHRVDEAIHRAVQSAESRVTTEIQKRLTQGITVRIGATP